MTQLTNSASPPPDSRPFMEDFLNYLGILLRGWPYILISVVICLTLAAIHVSGIKPVYNATTRLLILQQGGRPLAGSGGDPFQQGNFNDYIPTHIMIIRSPMVVERAITDGELKGISASQIVNGLKVIRPDPSAKILEIAYQSGSRDEAIRVLKAVTESYGKFLADNYQKNTTEVISLISRARDNLSKELQDLEQKYLVFRQEHPIFLADDGGRSLLTRRLDQWDSAANEAMIKGVHLKVQIDLAKKLADSGAPLKSIASALRALGAGPDVTPDADGTKGSSVGSYQQIGLQLDDIEMRRQTAQLLLEHLRAEQDNSVASRDVPEDEVVRAFYAEPTVSHLREQLETTKRKIASVWRITHNPSDPVCVEAQRRKKELQNQLDRLWQRERPEIIRHLGDESGGEIDELIHKSESELITLRAQEGALRKRQETLKADYIRQLDQQKTELTQRHGPESPEVRRIEELITRIERPSQPGDRAGEGQARALMDSIANSLTAIESTQVEMRRRFEKDLAAAKDDQIDRLKEENLRANLERHRALFNSIVDQLKQAQLVSDFGSITAQTLNPAEASATRPKMITTLAMALVAGCGLGLAMAFVSDLLDPRVRTLSEVRRALDFPVLGLIPQLTKEDFDMGGEVGLISHAKPRSVVSESYKAVRTSLEFCRRNQHAQVILITSAHSGDGKSTSASNLAISLALAGRKVLLVDGDLRKPSQHLIYNHGRELGLAHVLKGLLPISRAVHHTPVEGLDLMPAGPDVSNPAELFASNRFDEFLTEARRLYDIVIIDSSPILAVTDPCIVGSAADGIVLVVRATTLRRHEADRTMELLKNLGTPVLGIVVNGITRQQMGYGYGYVYGYGYGYGVYGSSGSRKSIESSTARSRADLANGEPINGAHNQPLQG